MTAQDDFLLRTFKEKNEGKEMKKKSIAFLSIPGTAEKCMEKYEFLL